MNISKHGVNQAETSSTARENSFTTKPARSYVNLEFHEITKRPPGRRTPRQKLNPNDVRAGCRFGKDSNSVKENVKNENSGLLGDGLGFLPRALSFVEEESQETVSRGTSPMPSPLLRQASSSSKSPDCAFDKPDIAHPSESLDEEKSEKVSETPIQDTETALTVDCEDAVNTSHTNEGLQMEQEGNSEDKDHEKDEGEDECQEYTENMPELVNDIRFYATGSYEKEEDKEVNLRENAEVEVLEESEGGWWLVRTSSHSVGWAPSNFLEKVRSLKGGFGDSSGKDLQDETFLDVIPIRPPKSPKVLKMAQDMSIEKKFWYYIQKGKDIDTCPLDKKEVNPQRTSYLNIKNNQPQREATEATENNNEVTTFTFDDYECDLESGVCMRKGPKLAGVKYVPQNNVTSDKGHLKAEYDGPGLTERSESVPSLAESEDFDDLPSD